jgi:hypothetical protein
VVMKNLHQVFDHWLEWLDWLSKNNGEYYPWSKHWLIYFLAASTGEWGCYTWVGDCMVSDEWRWDIL